MKNKKTIWVIMGPNLNMLGIREPDVYGNKTYKEYLNEIKEYAKNNGINVKCFQSNSEGKIIDYIQKAYFKKVAGIIINPGAYTHYAYSIRDAIASVNIDTIEVHISDINNREDFRKISVIRDVVKNCFIGNDCYIKALEELRK